ncbi:MAG TPA: hypothetical protein VGQ12_08085 [Candidatus Angelobacter sp.]|jgi:hypothetical protein|nr:hypothetical protein [Candidatus Angelobacter sp.]
MSSMEKLSDVIKRLPVAQQITQEQPASLTEPGGKKVIVITFSGPMSHVMAQKIWAALSNAAQQIMARYKGNLISIRSEDQL